MAATTSEPGWSTLSTGETDFMTQLLNTHSCPSDDDLQLGTGSGLDHGSNYWHGDYESTAGHEHLLNYSDDSNSNLYSSSNTYHLDDSCDILATNDDSMTTMDLYVGSEKIMGGLVHDMKGEEEIENEDCLIDACNENFHDSGLPPLQMNIASVPANSKKRYRTSNVQKNERYVKSRKCSKQVAAKKEEESSGGRTLQSTSSSSSEEISNFSQGSKGKTRASRGSATDPQSLYARKRRERINERLKILQNLVPNGTKVDISTMLEEAVQYVNFLKLQIKLLSSDELWMYAPLAHNGMDIELDMKINMLNALKR